MTRGYSCCFFSFSLFLLVSFNIISSWYVRNDNKANCAYYELLHVTAMWLVDWSRQQKNQKKRQCPCAIITIIISIQNFDIWYCPQQKFPWEKLLLETEAVTEVCCHLKFTPGAFRRHTVSAQISEIRPYLGKCYCRSSESPSLSSQDNVSR